jgi:hypothetical protein
MPNLANQVQAALIAEVNKVAGIGEVSKKWKLWIETSRFPAIYAIRETVSKEFTPTRSKTVEENHRLVAVLQSDDPETDFNDLMDAIEVEIDDDPALGGLVEIAFVSGAGAFATTDLIAGGAYIREIFVRVEYKHVRGAP